MRVILFIIALALLYGCSLNKNAANALSGEKYIENVIKDNFGDNAVEKLFNLSGDFVILKEKIERGTGFPDVTNFLVVDIKQKKIIYKDSLPGGSVLWKNNDVIVVKRSPDARSKVDEENERAKLKEINIHKL